MISNVLPVAGRLATFKPMLLFLTLPHFSKIGGLLIFACAVALGLVLFSLYRNNRLLFWCLAGALGGHLLFAGIFYGIGYFFKPPQREVRITIASFKLPPVTKSIPPPKRLDMPLGSLKGNRQIKKMPHGHRLDVKHNAHPNPGRPMTSGVADDGAIPLNEKDQGLFTGNLQDLETKDINTLTSSGKGEDGGTPEGEGSGDVPAGFPEGKVNGRVYFIRMKHDSGAWNAYDDGTRRLLGFLNGFFPCESESRAMTAAEMRERFMNKGSQPCFLYVYCDDSFSLSSSEVTILHDYMAHGGFLFMDSRPDPAIRTVVGRELDRILPGLPLKPLSRNHPINTFLFRTADPVVGENTVTMQNYGVAQNGRLVVFYTMGNFSHLYASHTASELPYFAAQYQMGANVMLYAIRKGDNSGITQHAGASAKITTEALEHLGMLEPTSAPAQGGKPPESVKVKPTAPPGGKPGEEQPDDIKVIE